MSIEPNSASTLHDSRTRTDHHHQRPLGIYIRREKSAMQAITALGNWVGSWLGPDQVDNEEAMQEETAKPPFEPDVLDVIVVKAMLVKGLHLPPELVDSIVDQSEYWPHTSSEVNYMADTRNFYTVGFLTDAEDSENELLLRSIPLGFRTWPRKGDREGTIHRSAVAPKPPGEQFPADAFQDLMGYPVPLVTHPCRKIVFTIRSRDQGWGGDAQDHGTYHGSWTWFEAGLERWTRKKGSQPPEAEEQPSLALDEVATIYPPVVARTETTYKYDHALLPSEYLKIQCNKTAVRETIEHQVVWSYTDDMDPQSVEHAAKLAFKGRGTASGDGKFVRELQLGDMVTIWGKTRFPGWSSHVDSVKIDVYWVV